MKLELKDIHKMYKLGNTEIHALNGIELSIQSNDFITIAGPSGSGKSTLLNLIGCLDIPSRGDVILDDEK
ncbi:MAG TPA: hypothetical protein DC049_06560, partial [Spirochaetia bacterium]|nr:hypothetical protein [Spirochaetia bacterium]